MNDPEIIIEVAKLNGYDGCTCGEAGCQIYGEPKYLTSRDAIIPVIEKQNIKTQVLIGVMVEEIIINELNCDPETVTIIEAIKATPRQLCIALLKAAGKWKESP